MRPLAIIYKRGRELSPALNKFIEVLTASKIPMPGGVRHGAKADSHERAADSRERAPKEAPRTADR